MASSSFYDSSNENNPLVKLEVILIEEELSMSHTNLLSMEGDSMEERFSSPSNTANVVSVVIMTKRIIIFKGMHKAPS